MAEVATGANHVFGWVWWSGWR